MTLWKASLFFILGIALEVSAGKWKKELDFNSPKISQLIRQGFTLSCKDCSTLQYFLPGASDATKIGCPEEQVCGPIDGGFNCIDVDSPDASECSCGGAENAFIPDPYDPMQYYACLPGGDQVAQTCPVDQFFTGELPGQCATTPKCDVDNIGFNKYEDSCTRSYFCEKDAAIATISTCETGTVWDVVNFGCVDPCSLAPEAFTCGGKEDGAHPDPTDCAIFHLCFFGTHIEQQCTGDKPFYDTAAQGCTDTDPGPCLTTDLCYEDYKDACSVSTTTSAISTTGTYTTDSTTSEVSESSITTEKSTSETTEPIDTTETTEPIDTTKKTTTETSESTKASSSSSIIRETTTTTEITTTATVSTTDTSESSVTSTDTETTTTASSDSTTASTESSTNTEKTTTMSLIPDCSKVTTQEYFTKKESCQEFYSCESDKNGAFTLKEYSCPGDLVFDPVNQYCNLLNLVPSCGDGSSTVPPSLIDPTTDSSTDSSPDSSPDSTTDSTSDSKTYDTIDCDQVTSQTYYTSEETCNKFYSCESDDKGGFSLKEYSCPGELVFDPINQYCNLLNLVPSCQ